MSAAPDWQVGDLATADGWDDFYPVSAVDSDGDVYLIDDGCHAGPYDASTLRRPPLRPGMFVRGAGGAGGGNGPAVAVCLHARGQWDQTWLDTTGRSWWGDVLIPVSPPRCTTDPPPLPPPLPELPLKAPPSPFCVLCQANPLRAQCPDEMCANE